MLPRNHPDRIQIAFDDHRLVANAGLLLPVTLAQTWACVNLHDDRRLNGNLDGRLNGGFRYALDDGLRDRFNLGGDRLRMRHVFRPGRYAPTEGDFLLSGVNERGGVHARLPRAGRRGCNGGRSHRLAAWRRRVALSTHRRQTPRPTRTARQPW